MSKLRKLLLSLCAATMLFLGALSASGCVPNTDDEKMTFGIIAAMDEEVSGIKDAIQNPETVNAAGSDYIKGQIGDFNVVVTKCGVGKVSASISAQYLIDNYHPDFIVNTGTAGALSPSLNVGDIVVATKTAEWDMDITSLGYSQGYISALNEVYLNADAELAKKISEHTSDGVKVVNGLIVSGDEFVGSQSQRDAILQNFPDALCAEMEGAAIGHVCCQNEVPFCIFRCISDNANGDSGVDFNQFAAEAGKTSAQNLVNFLNYASSNDFDEPVG